MALDSNSKPLEAVKELKSLRRVSEKLFGKSQFTSACTLNKSLAVVTAGMPPDVFFMFVLLGI